MITKLNMLRNQKGFTLVELAVVLVIIGIILGGVLKGQDLINNSKAKKVLSDMQGMTAMAYTFSDRYGRFPGDCNKNGIVDYGTLNSQVAAFATTAAPAFCNPPNNAQVAPNPQYNEMIQAQFLPNTAPLELSKNNYNGAKYLASVTVNNVAYNVAVATGIPCYAAKMVDNNIDGSLDAGLGYIREVTGATTLRTATDAWTACAAGEQTLVNIAYFFDRRPN